MSLNCDDKGAGGAGASDKLSHLQAPRLQSGGLGYAAWQANMDVFLQRAGAEGIHRKPLQEAAWVEMVRRVEEWSAEELNAALALVVNSATGANSSSGSSTAPLTSQVKEARRLVSATVERSRKVFGTLYSALPEELRAQVAHLAQGWAYGLWHWLETKFQSTEQDSVGELLAQWTTLRQEDDESFDAYRARVNRLHTLLEQAQEKPSARMYAYMMLDRLQPRYKQAVLALKVGEQLKDAEKIAWDTVAAFLNAHERSEQRIGADGYGGAALVAAAQSSSAHQPFGWAQKQQPGAAFKRGATGGSSSGGSRQIRAGGNWRGKDKRTCFRCDERGHVAAVCPNPPKLHSHRAAAGTGSARSFSASAPGAAVGEQASAATQAASVSSNRFDVLSSDDDDDSTLPGHACLNNHGERTCMTLALGAKAVSAGGAAAMSFLEAEARGRGSREAPKQAATAVAATATKSAGDATPGFQSDYKTAPRALQQQSIRTAMASSAQKPRSGSPLDEVLANDGWGWDTMASSCCSGNRARFWTLRRCMPVPVKVADGSIINATHVGSVVLRVKTDSGHVVRIVINNVLYHERFASNLLSGELLTKKLGWQYHSTPQGSHVVTPGGHRITLCTSGRVAVLIGAGPERACSTVMAATQSEARDAVADALVRLHERMVHCGWTRMLHMLHSGRVLDHGIDLNNLNSTSLKAAEARVRQCTACLQGKATRTAFGHRGIDRGTKAGECVHLDTYQVKVERDGGIVVEYGLVMKDMYSGNVWHAQLRSKDEVADAVIELIRRTETQFGCVVKRLYADGGTEFINQKLKAFCSKAGKELHWTPARSQQLNGAAERTVRTFKDYERTMVQHAGAPTKLWGRAASHAAFVWNRTHISGDTGMTPYEALRGKKPSLRHIHVWGCDAFCHVPKEQRGVLESKVEPCIYLGHNEAQNAAYVLLLSTRKVITSRDVTFRSGSFSFMRAIQNGDGGVREALQLSDDELRAEVADDANGQSESDARVQGAQDLVQHDDEDATAEDEEYVVERIVGQRRRNGRLEYKVRWAGYGEEEDSWEPESACKELAAMDTWLAKQPLPRRSPRNAPKTEEDDADDSEEPQVHMAMCALRSLQLPDEQPVDDATVMSAVAAGIAALERQTPKTYREAMASPDAPKWQAALDKEMRSCERQKVWTLVRRDTLPRGTNILPCKEVFKIKLDEHGRVVEHKARFTPKGFRQKHGVDFFDTFARTGQYKTLRVALSLVAKWDHELAQFDVPTAFLNAPVDEDIYMELPEGYEQAGMVCKLHKSLYGLKQAPRNWDKLVHEFISKVMGFKAAVSDPSLYFKRSRSGRLMMIYRFVDDMQGSHHAEDAAEFQQSISLLQKRFNIKQLKTATWMLGMRITRDRKARTITLDQQLFVSKALERFGLQQCRIVSTPEAIGAAHDQQSLLEQPADRQRYMEMTGTLMYAAISTRPDIAHAVHYLASNMQAPTKRHMLAAERVFRYLAGTKDVGLVFGSRNGETVGDSRGRKPQVQVDVCAFADADWANDKGDRRSVTGWVAKLNGDPVSWSSKKQRVVALSTCEAELYAEAAAIQEVLWLRGLMEELGLHTQTGSTVYGDNQSAIAVSENGVKGERTKHVDVKYHFVTETVEQGVIKLCWVPTTQQQADIFTKALAAPVFLLMRRQLMSC